MSVSVLVVLFSACALVIHAEVTFWCDAEGVMTLTSFPSKANKIALIDNVPTAITGSTELKINAEKETAVIVAFSDYDMSSVFAADTEAYTLQCNEINAAGVSATVMANAAASISTELKTVKPTFTVLSRFTDDYNLYIPRTSVVVAEYILFTIHIPDEYVMNIDSCDGYAFDGGQKVADVPPIRLLGNNGCTDPTLNAGGVLMTEMWESPLHVIGNYKVYEGWVIGFKFFGHAGILIECAIKVCPIDGTCGELAEEDCSRRKRRYSEPKDDGSFSMITRNVIKVLDPYTLGTASMLSVNISAILLSTLALLLVLE